MTDTFYGSAVGTLRIERARDGAAIFRRMKIEVDGRTAARVGRGKSVTVDLEPGEHSVRARMDWQTSPTLQVRVGESSTVLVKVEYPMAALGKLVRGAEAAIRIALDGDGTTPSDRAR